VNGARATDLSRKAAVARYFPSLSVDADYGLGGSHPSAATPVADVRAALLNLQSSAEQVNERWFSRVIVSARVSPIPWKVVQSQELVASAHEQYISSLYNYNYAKNFPASPSGHR
jgi:hypothetical protein